MKKMLSAALVGLVAAAQAQQPAIHPTTLSSSAGRFVFGQINGLARDQYMLDTQSGRLWQIVCVKADESDGSKCLLKVLQAVSYDSELGQSDVPLQPQSSLYSQRKKQDDPPAKPK